MKNSKESVLRRQLDILNMIRDEGEVTVEKLASLFQISVITIRRDLVALERQSLITRVHGGAISLDRSDAKPIGLEDETIRCRNLISRYATRYLEDGDKLFINGSMIALNTLEHVKNTRVHAYTNNGRAIGKTYPEGVSVTISGGELRNNIFVGEYVIKNILDLSADKTFIGCASVYETGEFCYDIPTEIAINEVMISRTRKGLYVLADHTKLKHRNEDIPVYGGCIYDRPVTLITDSLADRDIVKSLRAADIKVITVPA